LLYSVIEYITVILHFTPVFDLFHKREAMLPFRYMIGHRVSQSITTACFMGALSDTGSVKSSDVTAKLVRTASFLFVQETSAFVHA